ncbi:hypothetical protein COV12_01195 [Candidatus Woesearchaeota archaeon CG10_big_fil_rev_8_21_14_0_10_32_24]|nr:MAG: hypothetical protein COV12_01195 [Candidatus Woesearchaeota archaeon CG10_big_fil_rev_8_21_14_0_10_32_24]
MIIQKVHEQIYHVRFKSQNNLSKTFCRFQQHFESPFFKGKYFSMASFKRWYITHSPDAKKTGRFTYYQDWAGYNVPSYVFKPFQKGKFDPLSPEETALLTVLPLKEKKKFYVIGTYGNHTKDTIQHEIAHGLFFTNKEYRKDMLRLIYQIDKQSREAINHHFAQTKGYHHDVWLDETHAYIMTMLDHLKKNGVNINPLKNINKEMNILFKKYVP